MLSTKCMTSTKEDGVKWHVWWSQNDNRGYAESSLLLLKCLLAVISLSIVKRKGEICNILTGNNALGFGSQEISIKIVIASSFIQSSNLTEKTTRKSSLLLELLGQVSVFLKESFFQKLYIFWQFCHILLPALLKLLSQFAKIMISLGIWKTLCVKFFFYYVNQHICEILKMLFVI